MPLRRLPLRALLAIMLCGTLGPIWAQDYPQRPIRVIVPFAAGSTADIIARSVSDKMGENLGQPFVIENRGGASGTIGQQAVASAAPDGYTLMIHSSSHTVSPWTFKKLPFDTQADFAGITPIAMLPNVLVVLPQKGYASVKDLVDQARARPGELNFASAGQGSATHLNAEKFRTAAGIEAVNIPFKGSGEAVTELLAGRVDYYFSPIAPVIGQIKEGRLVPLAVASPRRAAALPEVPTVAQAGVPGAEFNFWIGLLAPSGVPQPVIDRLYEAARQAFASPDVQRRFLELGAEAWTLPPAEFDDYIKKEIASNAELVKAAGISPQ